MSEDWAAIAVEIEDAIASVGFAATLEAQVVDSDPEGSTTSTETITVIDDRITRRDAGGMVTGNVRVLTIKGNGTTPLKGWRVQVRGTWHRIANVMPLAPGGVDLLYDLEVEG